MTEQTKDGAEALEEGRQMTTLLRRPDPEPPVPEPAPQPSAPEIRHWDEIACRDCGRSFLCTDGRGMLDAIEGNCPDCGGAFELAT
jgi:hypothetical protein